MREALMVIDMQTDLLAAEGRFPVAQEQVDGLLRATNAAVEGAFGRGSPVAYIRNVFRAWDPGNLFRGGCCVRGRAGAELDPRLRTCDGAAHFEKWRGSAFCNDELDAWLRLEGVRSIAVAGVYANACVLATVRSALRRGLDVTVLGDAVAAGGESARSAALEKMRRAGATVASVETWLCEDRGVSA